MSLSVRFYESDIAFSPGILEKINNYHNPEGELHEVSLLFEEIMEGADKYRIFKIAKKVKSSKPTYVLEGDMIVSTEENYSYWDVQFAYFKVDSKELYVEGSSSGWISTFLSNILFADETKIKLKEIDLRKLEDDIKQKANITPFGTCFEDGDGTIVRLVNFDGLDLESNRHVQGCGEVEKAHIGIIIERDDLQLKASIYPTKITLWTYKHDRKVALRIFLKVWKELEDYTD